MIQSEKYSAVGQSIHWLTVILVLTAFLFGPGGPESRIYSSAHDLGREIHETLGLSVFTLVIIRLIWRAGASVPPPPDVPPWMRIAAKVVKYVLYALMLALPITAITGAWLEGHDLTLLGGVTIAPRLAESHELGKTIVEIHTWLGDSILWVAGFHASAALFHHAILGDGVLASMLPDSIARRIPRL